ncbi:MAG: acetylxylan esterase [Halobacteria archaeon]
MASRRRLLLLLLPFAIAAIPLSLPVGVPDAPPNTGWWDFAGLDAPLEAEFLSNRTLFLPANPRGLPAAEVVERQVRFYSQTWDGQEIRIHGYLYHPLVPGGGAEGPRSGPGPAGARGLPGVVVAHGFGGKGEDMAPFARDLAQGGYVALAYSAPGQGNSTGPRNNQSNFARVERGPQDAWLARNIHAARRALSLLESLPEVDGSRLAILGGSQGGVTSFLVSALDPRVKASVPVVASGDWVAAIRSGGAANFIAPGRVNAASPESAVLISSFDVLGYAPSIRVPTLMLIGTDDEFFPLPGAVRTFEALGGPKAIDLLPNAGHAGEEDWNLSAYLFLEHHLDGGPRLPAVEALVEPLPLGGARVAATAPGAESVTLSWRDDLTGSRWQTRDMARSGDRWEGAVPWGLTDQWAYAGARVQGLQVSSTVPVRVPASPLLQALAAVTVGALIGLLLRHAGRIREWANSSPAAALRVAAGLLFAAASLLPVLEFSGRTRVTLWQELRQFAHLLPPWLPYLALLLVLLVPALALRHRRWAALLAVGGPVLLLGGIAAVDLLTQGLVLMLPGGGLLLALGAGLVLWRAKDPPAPHSPSAPA